MFQFVYISTMAAVVDADQIGAILSVSRRNNATTHLTGLLLHRGRRFMQVLEGRRDDVLATVGRIRSDPRHMAIVALSERAVPERQFGAWAMASDRELPVEQMMARIDQLTAHASPNLRAQFMGYAGMTAG